MKKFVRSKFKGISSDAAAEISEPKGVVISGPADIVITKSIDPLEALKKQLDSLSNENAKLKTSVQRLSDDNLYLHEQLEILHRQKQRINNGNGPIATPDKLPPPIDSQEIQQSIKTVLDENDHLTKRLSMEQDQNAILSTNFDREIKRLTRLYEDSRLENSRLERNLENTLLDVDNLRIQIGVWQKECSEKLSPEEFLAKFETSKLMMEELKEKYRKDLEQLTTSLNTCQSEKKQIALKFVEIQSNFTELISTNEQLEQKFSKVFNDNRSLNETLLETNKKLLQAESTLNDLLELCKEILTKKSREELVEDQKREALEFRLKKIEVKYRHLADENRKLKNYKSAAAVKLKQARHYLLHEDES